MFTDIINIQIDDPNDAEHNERGDPPTDVLEERIPPALQEVRG